MTKMPVAKRGPRGRTIMINPWTLGKGLYGAGKAGHAIYKKAKAAYYGPPARGATTVQQDVKMTRKKRVNKRVLKRKQRFRQKIERALAPGATHHTYTEIMTDNVTIQKTNTNPGVQEQYLNAEPTQNITLNTGTNSGGGGGVTYLKDSMHSITSQPDVATGAQKGSGGDQKDLKILSSHLDLALTNQSTQALVFDVYWCAAAMTDDNALYASPGAAWKTLLAQNSYLGPGTVAGGIETVQTHNGTTPHTAPGFGKYWKILSKQRVYLQSGGTSEFSFSGGAYSYSSSKFSGMTNVAGLTKGLMIVGGIGDNSALLNGGAVFSYHTTRRYRFTYPHGKDQIPNLPTNTTRIIP